MASFPSGEQRIPISVEGGTEPRWRKDGRELYFRQGVTSLMSVDIKATAASLEAGIPKRLAALPFSSDLDVTEDGQRFLVSGVPNFLSANAEDDPLTVFINWTGRLKQ